MPVGFGSALFKARLPGFPASSFRRVGVRGLPAGMELFMVAATGIATCRMR